MKRCPTCQRTYPDAQSFCESEGDVLVVIESLRPTPVRSLVPTMPVAPPPPDVPMVTGGIPLRRAIVAKSIESLRAITLEALDVAALFARARLAWHPQPEDFVIDAAGRLGLSQARGVGISEVFDARWVLRALGEALSPTPLVFAPTALVRSLLEPREGLLSVDAARDEIAKVAAPNPTHAHVAKDVGFARERQEDSVLEADVAGARVLVLCDGVSLSADGELASRTGSAAALARAKELLPLENADDVAIAEESIHAAHEAVCDAVEVAMGSLADTDIDPPGATIVVAIVREGSVSVGWLGDSRAYIVSGDRGELITRDHSWKNEVERLGYEPSAAAMGGMANALTRCIGPLEGGARTGTAPEVVQKPLPAGSTLVVCSDGLWSYYAAPDAMARLVQMYDDVPDGTLAERLVNHALVCGGEDNVSVAVSRG